MANFTSATFLNYDDYMTPKSAWEDIKQYIPKDKVIWEAFYGNGDSGRYLKELGFNVIHEPIDFFSNDKGDIIITNPAFSKAKEVLERLDQLNKPFIIILPSSKINTSYFRNIFINKDIQLIIPKKRIHFKKIKDGQVPDNYKSSCNFDCFYYCYKIHLQKDITFIL
jgi:vacuolar-type H+-ATPase subunit F/Vma7